MPWTAAARQKLRDLILNSNLELRGIVQLLDSDGDGVVGLEDLKRALQKVGVAATDHNVRLLLRTAPRTAGGDVDVWSFLPLLGAALPASATDEGLAKQLKPVVAMLGRSGLGMTDLFQVCCLWMHYSAGRALRKPAPPAQLRPQHIPQAVTPELRLFHPDQDVSVCVCVSCGGSIVFFEGRLAS